MNDYWIIVIVAIVFIIIAYGIGFEAGYDKGLDDIIKDCDDALRNLSKVANDARDNKEKEGTYNDN